MRLHAAPCGSMRFHAAPVVFAGIAESFSQIKYQQNKCYGNKSIPLSHAESAYSLFTVFG